MWIAAVLFSSIYDTALSLILKETSISWCKEYFFNFLSKRQRCPIETILIITNIGYIKNKSIQIFIPDPIWTFLVLTDSGHEGF